MGLVRVVLDAELEAAEILSSIDFWLVRKTTGMVAHSGRSLRLVRTSAYPSSLGSRVSR